MLATADALALRQRMRFTLSGLARARQCPGSVVLPRVRWTSPWAEEGRIVHRFLQQVSAVGEVEALAQVPDDHREACEGIDLDQLPVLDREHFGHEVAFAYNPETGEARYLGSGLTREQVEDARRPGEITGIADVLGVAYEQRTGRKMVVVADYKRGWLDTGPIREHWQLRGYALVGCRAFGADLARILRIRIPATGRPWYDWTDLDVMDLDGTEYAIQQTVEGAARVSAALDAGAEPELRVGDHCAYCPAMPRCPAVTALVAKARDGKGFALPPLTLETAPQYLELANVVLAAGHWIRGAVDRFSREQPIPLGDGRLYGPHESRKPRVAFTPAASKVLEEKFGDLLDVAAPRRVTISSIRTGVRALRKVNRAVKVEATVKDLRDALKAGGALTMKVTHPVGPYRPKDGQDDGEEEVGGDDDDGGAGGGGD